MPAGLRGLLAVLAGLGLALGITFAVEALNSHLLFPLPPGTDPHDAESMQAAMAQLPRAALLVVLLGWALSAVAGGWVAARVGGRLRQPARLVGAILLGVGIFNLSSFPHPTWFRVVGILLFLPAAELGARLAGAQAQP
jgi:hypothetical protein